MVRMPSIQFEQHPQKQLVQFSGTINYVVRAVHLHLWWQDWLIVVCTTPLQDFREVKQVCEALYDGKGPNEIGERDHGGVQNYQKVSTYVHSTKLQNRIKHRFAFFSGRKCQKYTKRAMKTGKTL